jgi:hypothetical protein
VPLRPFLRDEEEAVRERLLAAAPLLSLKAQAGRYDLRRKNIYRSLNHFLGGGALPENLDADSDFRI